MKIMKLGIIGCGIITREAHIPALLALEDRIRVLGVCNRSREKGMAAAALLSLPENRVFDRKEAMFESLPELDAVLVALPIPQNYPVSRECLEAGAAVLCEKPAGADGREARKTLNLIRPEGPLFRTGENYHHCESFRRGAELIREGKIGRLHSLSWNSFRYAPVEGKYNQTLWRRHNSYPGGYVLDGGVHFVHALEMLAGPVSSVYGRTGCVEPALGSLDTAFGIFCHPGGVFSSLNMGWRSAGEKEGLMAFGDQGALEISMNSLAFIDPEGGRTEIFVEAGVSFRREWEDFHRAWSGEAPAAMDQGLAVRDVLVIEALLRSGESGRPETVDAGREE